MKDSLIRAARKFEEALLDRFLKPRQTERALENSEAAAAYTTVSESLYLVASPVLEAAAYSEAREAEECLESRF